MTKSKGYRTKTRTLLKKNPRERGKTSLSKLLYEYKPGEKVLVRIDSSIHKGMPHRRYHGKVAVIANRKGHAYTIKVKQGKAIKEIIVRPEHLTPYKER
jgi:large subunit ribosomal protein L21e